MTRIEITDDMVAAYGVAWAQADAQKGDGPEPGVRRRAGLDACLEVLERTHHVIPRATALEGTELALDPILERYPDDPEVATLVAMVARYRRLVLQPRTLDPMERSEGGWIQLVTWLMDQLGQREVHVPTSAWDEEERRLHLWRDFVRDAWTLQVDAPSTGDPADPS